VAGVATINVIIGISDHERAGHQPRDLFRSPLLDSAAAEGRWLGSYDVPLTANGRVETPMFKLPHRSAHRVRNFVLQMVDRGYSHLCGMMGWHYGIEAVCGLNIAALAEWSWNPNGRSIEQFAFAWALREGMSEAEAAAAFVEWHSMVGPIEWDVFDSGEI
jgi:hypothetical protein